MKNILRYLAAILASFHALNAQPIGWSIQSSPTTQNLHGVTFSDMNIWIAVGDAGTILRSNDGGFQWTVISSPIVDALRSVSFRGNLGLAVGISGQVLRTTDSGLNWIKETRPTNRNLYSVSFGDQMAVATGEEGTILVSLDDGLSWTPHTAGTASILFGVSVHDTTAVGVGGQGAVVMSVDHGKGWGLTVLGGQLTFFYSTSFMNGATGWAVGSSASTGNVIIHSTDYGFVWTSQIAPTTEQLFGVSFVTMDSGYAVGTNGTIIHTSDGGTNWLSDTSRTTQSLNAVSFADSRIGVAVGDGGIILRTTTGTTASASDDLRHAPNTLHNFTLEQNYPNPFNPATKISFRLSSRSFVSLNIYDVIGRNVATLISENLLAGNYTRTWNAANSTSGVYFYRLQIGSFEETKKLVLLR